MIELPLWNMVQILREFARRGDRVAILKCLADTNPATVKELLLIQLGVRE